jgi:hypothetical protein
MANRESRVIKKERSVQKMLEFLPFILDEDKQSEIFKFLKEEICPNDGITDDVEVQRILTFMQKDYFCRKLTEVASKISQIRQKFFQNPQSIGKEEQEKQIILMDNITKIITKNDVPKNIKEMKFELNYVQQLLDILN